MKMFLYIILTILILFLVLPRYSVASDPSETVLKNIMFAEQIHREGKTSEAYPYITDEWDIDWTTFYIADREIHLGQDVSVEVPDIRAKWERGEYRR